MRKILFALSALALIGLAGCGGGSGCTPGATSGTLATSSDGKVSVVGLSTAVASGTVLTVQSKAATQFTPSIVGPAFISAASVGPVGTSFSIAVNLSFTLPAAVPSGTEVRLYKVDLTSGTLVDTGTKAQLSSDGLTATAAVESFSSDSYVLLK